MEIIRVKNLSFKYSDEEKEILKDININIQEGEFLLLIGESGCGKSTFLKQLKNELAPYGEAVGEIIYDNSPLRELEVKRSAAEIGFVMQNPNYQIVTEKVWHELAFGLESLGVHPEIIRRRVAEMASFFGIEGWFNKDINDLSGGQKQLLNLASIMVMQPRVLILDEPTAQLDPIAATEFLETIYKINRELGVTIIITEHRLEEVFAMADKVALMDKGQLVAIESPKVIGTLINEDGYRKTMFYALPTATKVFYQCKGVGEAPTTIREGRNWLRSNVDNITTPTEKELKLSNEKREVVLELEEVSFRYERNSKDILDGINLKVYNNEFLCILGGNGVGKSTALSVITGINTPYRGQVLVKNKKINKYKVKELFFNFMGVLPQDPQSLFVKNTVIEDLREVFIGTKEDKATVEMKLKEVIELLDFEELLNRHPYDLSGGEQQKVALGKILLLNPKILILDEPTKGLDGGAKKEVSELLKRLQKRGITIVMVTHDIEFAAENADRCVMLFNGDVVSEGTAREFFCGNSFYTTAASKMTRGILKDILIGDDVVELWKRS